MASELLSNKVQLQKEACDVCRLQMRSDRLANPAHDFNALFAASSVKGLTGQLFALQLFAFSKKSLSKHMMPFLHQ